MTQRSKINARTLTARDVLARSGGRPYNGLCTWARRSNEMAQGALHAMITRIEGGSSVTTRSAMRVRMRMRHCALSASHSTPRLKGLTTPHHTCHTG